MTMQRWNYSNRRSLRLQLLLAISLLFMLFGLAIWHWIADTNEVAVLNSSQNYRFDPAQSIEATLKLKRLGTNALPAMLDMLDARDSAFAELSIVAQRIGISLNTQPTTASEIRGAALRAFEVLGPVASPAIPQLTKMIEEGNRPLFAVAALKSIGKDALPALAGALRNTNSLVRLQALSAMIVILPNDNSILNESFVFCFSDPDKIVRDGALRLFPRYSVPSTNVTCHMERLLDDPDPGVRENATQVVAAIKQLSLSKPRNR